MIILLRILYKKKSKIYRYKIDIIKKIKFYKTINIRDVKSLKLIYQKKKIFKSTKDY